MKRNLKFIASCTILATFSVSGFASALSPTSILDSAAPYDITSGWDFQLTQSFIVTALDYYDPRLTTGLLVSHQVGLWTSNGILLASATVPSGTAGTLNGTYRSVAISPIILTPGFYEIAGFVPGQSDKYVYDATFTTLPGIAYYESHVATGAFAFPGSQNLVSTKEVTANFEATAVQAVPEPGTAVLLPVGLIAVFACSGRRLRRDGTRSQPKIYPSDRNFRQEMNGARGKA